MVIKGRIKNKGKNKISFENVTIKSQTGIKQYCAEGFPLNLSTSLCLWIHHEINWNTKIITFWVYWQSPYLRDLLTVTDNKKCILVGMKAIHQADFSRCKMVSLIQLNAVMERNTNFTIIQYPSILLLWLSSSLLFLWLKKEH